MSKCTNCENGFVPMGMELRVTRDMAIDAGFPEMEGELIDTTTWSVICPCCHGDYDNCERCGDTTNF